MRNRYCSIRRGSTVLGIERSCARAFCCRGARSGEGEMPRHARNQVVDNEQRKISLVIGTELLAGGLLLVAFTEFPQPYLLPRVQRWSIAL